MVVVFLQKETIMKSSIKEKDQCMKGMHVKTTFSPITQEISIKG